jgi:hypothetical protein
MNPTTWTIYREYLDKTGNDAVAASLALADALQSTFDARPLAGAEPVAPPPDGMLNLVQAAAYLGITTDTVREIVTRTKASRAGQPIKGPTIEFFQNQKKAKILFRQEWLDDYIEQHHLKAGASRLPSKQQRRPATGRKQSPLVGGDRWDALCQ